MPRKSATTKAATIQTPGMETPPADDTQAGDPEAGGAGQEAGGEPTEGLPADVAALVAQEVAKQMARNEAARLRAKANPAGEKLPTQAEALAKVMADPKHRSVLSDEGWVTFQAPPKERDEHGFAKN